VGDYYSYADRGFTDIVVNNVRGTAEQLRSVVKEFADLGADELIFNPATDDLDDVLRLADVVL
jgi:hypothetical protein